MSQRPFHYILQGHTPVPFFDLLKWAEWFEKADRRVAYDEIGSYCISTVFIGLDHRCGEGPPLLFETLGYLKDTGAEVQMQRYSTWQAAEVGHHVYASLARATSHLESNLEQ